MKIVRQNDISDEQKLQIFELWNAEYPVKLSFSEVADFDEYLSGVGNKTHFLLSNLPGKIFGWALLFERENARWFAVILDNKIQGQGYGAKLINQLKETEDSLSGWVIDHDNDRKANGEKYKSPLGFYLKHEFEICENERIESEKMSGVKIKWSR